MSRVECRCGRPVRDEAFICDTCLDDLTALLRGVPGLVDDLLTTRVGLDKIGSRAGGKSAATPLYVRLTGRQATDTEIDERDTYLLPWRRKTGDDRVPTEGPERALAERIVYWGLQLELTNRTPIPVDAPGIRNTVVLSRATAGASTLAAGVVTRLIRDSDTKQLVPRPQRPVSRGAERLSTEPVTAHEAIAIWLAHNPDQIRRYENATAMHQSISDAVREAQRVIDRHETRYVGPCPTKRDGKKCGAELHAEKDALWVRCPWCREQHEVEHVRREAMRDAEHNLYPLPRIAELLELAGRPVPISTLHTWHYRGRIRPRGWLHVNPVTGTRGIVPSRVADNDRRVYRLGDVLRLAERQTTKSEGKQR